MLGSEIEPCLPQLISTTSLSNSDMICGAPAISQIQNDFLFRISIEEVTTPRNYLLSKFQRISKFGPRFFLDVWRKLHVCRYTFGYPESQGISEQCYCILNSLMLTFEKKSQISWVGWLFSNSGATRTMICSCAN